MTELPKFKKRILDTTWKKAIAVIVCIGLLAAMVVPLVLHFTGHLRRIRFVYHASQSSMAKDTP
jgi:hypothetical protein